MKKIIAILLSVLMLGSVFALASCDLVNTIELNDDTAVDASTSTDTQSSGNNGGSGGSGNGGTTTETEETVGSSVEKTDDGKSAYELYCAAVATVNTMKSYSYAVKGTFKDSSRSDMNISGTITETTVYQKSITQYKSSSSGVSGSIGGSLGGSSVVKITSVTTEQWFVDGMAYVKRVMQAEDESSFDVTKEKRSYEYEDAVGEVPEMIKVYCMSFDEADFEGVQLMKNNLGYYFIITISDGAGEAYNVPDGSKYTMKFDKNGVVRGMAVDATQTTTSITLTNVDKAADVTAPADADSYEEYIDPEVTTDIPNSGGDNSGATTGSSTKPSKPEPADTESSGDGMSSGAIDSESGDETEK